MFVTFKLVGYIRISVLQKKKKNDHNTFVDKSITYVIWTVLLNTSNLIRKYSWKNTKDPLGPKRFEPRIKQTENKSCLYLIRFPRLICKIEPKESSGNPCRDFLIQCICKLKYSIYVNKQHQRKQIQIKKTMYAWLIDLYQVTIKRISLGELQLHNCDRGKISRERIKNLS